MPRAKGYKPRHKGAGIRKAGVKIRRANLLRDIRSRKGKLGKGKQVKGAFFGALVRTLAPIAIEEIAKRI